jgi:hypothetical protein
MVETADETDPRYGIPLFSLVRRGRRPTGQMMSAADVFLFDLQDLGCRIYTFCTTLLYLLEEAAAHGKSGVGARPAQSRRAAGRRHLARAGAGELRRRRADADAPRADDGRDGPRGSSGHFDLDVDYRVIEMHDWLPEAGPAYGWPEEPPLDQSEPQRREPQHGEAYAGTVMIEGGNAQRRARAPRAARSAVRRAGRRRERGAGRDAALRARVAAGCAIRECWFTPTFHKHAEAVQRLDDPRRRAVLRPRGVPPWRLQALAFKAIRRLYPDYPIWRDFPTSTSSSGWRST